MMRKYAALAALLACGAALAADGDARLPGNAAAVEAVGAEKPFKLSFGEYRYGDVSGGDADNNYAGQDVNLRYRHGDSSLWVGGYRDSAFGRQSRAGADTSWQPFAGSTLALQPSVQVASGGFVGGSFSVELGEPWFVQAGMGRTNTKPYFNLNFDPNDAKSLAAGYRDDSGRTFYLMAIRDDRLGTHQEHVHAVGRWPLHNRNSLTVDLLHKTGNGDSGPVEAWGASLTLDLADYFLRLSRDPHQNFSDLNATRLSFGLRF